MAAGYFAPLAISSNDGPTLTAAAAATMLPVTAKYTFPPNGIPLPGVFRITAQGRISCAITTPGTARFDIRLGATVVFDSGPMNLNIVAKTTLPWWLEIMLVIRANGATGNFFGFSKWTSEAVIGGALGTVGTDGTLVSSVAGGVESAPAVGNNVDLTAANAFDCFFTQTVSTGSLTCHNFLLESASIATP